ncbi:MAG: exocyst complex component exo70 [Chrysothrix sp. TS-e1954]|nr:MAG: exocyst complex component exo70 [Chrysothrix sp. TS-e1954]
MPGQQRAAHNEDSAEVEVLFALTGKLRTLNKDIRGSLTRLESNGREIQDAIKPIYGNTSKLQVTNTNIDRLNTAINNIRKPLDKKRREDNVIRAGLQKVGLNDYLASLDRTQQTLNDLTNTNFRSNQQAIADMRELLNFGNQELESAFLDTMRSESSPVEPLNYITKNLPFPSISEESISKLRAINAFVSKGREPKTVNIYAETRGRYIKTTLQNLATSSLGIMNRKSGSENVYRKGDCYIGTYALALRQLFEAEYDNICPIFLRDQWTVLHTMTCHDAMLELQRTLKELHIYIKNNISTDCFLAYELVEIITELSFRLESKNLELKQPVQEALRPIRSTAAYSLTRLLEELKSRTNNIVGLSQDAAAVPVASEIMTRLQTMTNYLAPLDSILTSVGDGGWRSSGDSKTTSQAPTLRSFNEHELFSAYVKDTVHDLLFNLENKAKQLLKTKGTQGVFIANNLAIVDRAINHSDLQNLISDVTRSELDQYRQKSEKMYTDAWVEPGRLLHDAVHTNRSSHPGNRPPSGSQPGAGPVDSAAFVKSLSSKEKDDKKEKFKNFNIAFDDLIVRHKTYRMEPEVRDQFAKAIAILIEPLYDRFWDRYHEIDKGKGKYVRYDKQQLASVLASLG